MSIFSTDATMSKNKKYVHMFYRCQKCQKRKRYDCIFDRCRNAQIWKICQYVRPIRKCQNMNNMYVRPMQNVIISKHMFVFSTDATMQKKNKKIWVSCDAKMANSKSDTKLTREQTYISKNILMFSFFQIKKKTYLKSMFYIIFDVSFVLQIQNHTRRETYVSCFRPLRKCQNRKKYVRMFNRCKNA